MDELPVEEKPDPDLHLFYHDQWHVARHPLQDPDDPVYAVKADRLGGVGPGLSFARSMKARQGGSVGILLCARGGDGIQAWHGEGQFYQTMIKRLSNASSTRRLAGALIHIGEGDTRSVEAAESWRAGFASLVSALRKDAGNPTLPIVFAQIATITPERRARRDHGFVGWERLKQVQASIKLPNVGRIVTEDLPLKPDGLHLATLGAVELGVRFAIAMSELHNREKQQQIN